MARLPLFGLHGARRGQAADGRELAACFAHRLRNGGLTPDEAEMLASMLDAVADGIDPNVALLIKQRGAPSKVDRDGWIVGQVDELLFKGSSPTEAFRTVAKECANYGEKITAKTVKNIFHKWEAIRRADFNSMMDDLAQ